MRVLLFYRNLLRDNLAWFRKAGIIAGVWAVFGILAYLIQPNLLDQLIKYLDEVFRNILGEGELVLNLHSALLIFWNNLESALVSIFFGLVFGIVPFLALGFNFFIVGFLFAAFLSSSATSHGMPAAIVFVLSILPHGIVELPAFIIAAALGLRLGLFWYKPAEGESRSGNFIKALKTAVTSLPMLAVLFFVAAILEIFVTGNLVKWLTG